MTLEIPKKEGLEFPILETEAQEHKILDFADEVLGQVQYGKVRIYRSHKMFDRGESPWLTVARELPNWIKSKK